MALLTLASLALPGCRRVEAPANPGAAVVGVNRNALERTAQGPAQAPRGAQPLIVRPALEKRIAGLSGVKWPVVLQEGNQVYVGAFPEHAGAPRGDDTRTGFRGPKIWDSRADLAKQNPDVWIRALEQWYPSADTYDHRPRQRSGTMSPQTQADIRRIVSGALPGVRRVLITTDIASAAMLHGYAEYIRSGGDMTRFMNEFHRRVNLIWPNGRGVAPDRPSASPDFGTITRPADERTPARGPVRIS